jgi:hypothetical protein
MINFKEYLEEGKRGLWDNIHAKRKRIKAGSGERMRKPGSKGAPTDADFKAANEEVVTEGSDDKEPFDYEKWKASTVKPRKPRGYKDAEALGKAIDSEQSELRKRKQQSIKEELEAQFDLIEEVIEELALAEGLDSEFVWETLTLVTDEELLEYAIDKKGHKSSTGGLTQKGVDAYNAKTGGNLKTAVTTPPSKLKPGSKAANRRKSFCARMGGVEGPMKDDKGRPTRKALALRKWNC